MQRQAARERSSAAIAAMYSGHEREADADAAHQLLNAEPYEDVFAPINAERDAANVVMITPKSAIGPPPKRSVSRPTIGIIIAMPMPCGAQSAGPFEDALVTDLLEVERQQDHRAEQRCAEAEHRERRPRRRSLRRYRRGRAAALFARSAWSDERADQRASPGCRDHHLGELKLPVVPISARP